MQTNSLLVIIVIYNGMKWLDKCLSSVINSSIKADLFIVDNGSTDGSIEYIKKNYPDAQFIISKENLGFGKANNLGFRYALDHNYDYVYLLNQDAWVLQDTIAKLVAVHKSHIEYGLLSPLQTNRNITKLDNNFLNCCSRTMLSDCLCNKILNGVYETEFIMAAHWLIPVSTINIVGGFSPTFKHYGEDLNYVNRIKYFNLKIGIVPAAYAIHDRENRKESVEKGQYIFFVDNLVVLSNPNISKRIFRVINNYLQVFFKQRNKISISDIFKMILEYPKIVKNRKISMRIMPFLDFKKQD